MKYQFYKWLAVLVVAVAISAAVAGADESKIPPQPQRPPLALITPNGGEELVQGAIYKVTWISMPAAKSYSLLLNTANGKSWIEIAAGIAGTEVGCEWKVLQDPAEGCIVKVEAHMGDGAVFSDVSDKPFRVVGEPKPGSAAQTASSPGKLKPTEESIVHPLTPSPKLVSPNGGEVVLKGSLLSIVWSGVPEGVESALAISLDNGKNWQPLEAERGQHETLDRTTYQYRWMVDAPESKFCLIKVTAKDANGNLKDDVSDAPFQIMIERFGDKPRKAK